MNPLCCPVCRAPFQLPGDGAGPQQVRCPACAQEMEVEVFPALGRGPESGRAGDVATPGDAVCFVHADRRAESACDQCGRFMCALCDTHVGSRHLCVACFEEGRKGRKLVQVERQRTVFPAMAARLVGLGLFLGPLAPLVCLPAVALAVWGLARPTSVTGSRYVGSASIAIVGGMTLTLLWGAFWLTLVDRT